MGFPTRACREPTSEEPRKQSLRLVREVSLSMSWKMESLPGGQRGRQDQVQAGAPGGHQPCSSVARGQCEATETGTGCQEGAGGWVGLGPWAAGGHHGPKPARPGQVGAVLGQRGLGGLP